MRIPRGKHGHPALTFPGAFRDLENVGDPVSCEDRDLSSLYLLECIHISKNPAPIHFLRNYSSMLDKSNGGPRIISQWTRHKTMKKQK